jgi:hypothetical protein
MSHTRPRSILLAACCALVGATGPGVAAPSAEATAWLDGLTARVVADLAAGKPLVVQAHVPLCDNDVIPCGNARLGDGDHPEKNLYWATTEGFLGWFGRRGGGWKQVLDGDGGAIGEEHVLDLRVWRRELATPAAWRRAGAPARFTMYVVAQAWRGEEIHRAFSHYADDLYGVTAHEVTLADGTRIAAGGDAHVVAYVGHNHLMDLDAFDWAAVAKHADDRPRGAIAIACHTAVYMQDLVPGARQVPLVLTRDFLLASAAALEGAVLGFARGGDYAAIRKGAAAGYADGGDKPLRRVFGAFSNPADARWGTPSYSKSLNRHAEAHQAAQGR